MILKPTIYCMVMSDITLFTFQVLIPIVESQFLFEGQKTGLEFVHGGIVWLCVLTLYMIAAHLVRRKVSDFLTILSRID